MAMMIPAWIDGTLTPVEKLDAHLRGLRHMAVSVFVLDDTGRILLQKRAAGKYHTPGLWANTCCTHPDWDEAPEACARRRLDEELGITGLDPEYRGRIEYRADVGSGMIEHELVDIFVALATIDLSLRPNPDEVSQVRWISPVDLAGELETRPDEFTPWLRIYMKDHRDSILSGL